MSGTKEADLVTAVLLYAVRCIAENDQHALRSMNFGPKEIEALRELSVQDLYRVDTLQVHCLRIALNRQVYWPLVGHLQASRESETLQHELIQGGAPFEMMHNLFGMSTREYGRHRRQSVADMALGRPPEPDEGVSSQVFHAWSKREQDSEENGLTPSDYLDIQSETGASLRVIWTLIERWKLYGPLDSDNIEPAHSPSRARA